jgi:hypothetical protein
LRTKAKADCHRYGYRFRFVRLIYFDYRSTCLRVGDNLPSRPGRRAIALKFFPAD